MAFRTAVCIVTACDLCGNTETPDGGVVHHETETQALEYLRLDADSFPESSWHQRPDGRLVCWKRNPEHDWARKIDGVGKPGRDAMSATFSRETR